MKAIERFRSLLLLIAIMLMVGCASKSFENSRHHSMNASHDSHLNEKECMALSDSAASFLEKGFQALAQGEHISAAQFFQSHAWQKETAVSSWEASIAIAYMSMLPGSPFYDMEAVRDSYNKMNIWSIDDSTINYQIILMRDAIDAFVSLNLRLIDLERDNDLLEDNLAKRESALRRLRELTLGQQRGAVQ